MKKLEMGFEVQEKIMEAELQLAQDKSLPKSVRKKHRRTYRQEYQKVSHKSKQLSEDDLTHDFVTIIWITITRIFSGSYAENSSISAAL